MRTLTMTVVAVGIATGTAGAQEPLHADSNAAAEAEIEELEYHLIDLLQKGEIDTFASYLAEDYLRVNARGRESSKNEALAGFASSAAPVRQSPSDIEVRIYGDTAILSFVLTQEREGEPPTRSRLVKVFVRRDGRWIMVHNQGTAIE
jgi:ketosteroid isomerase-like protein